MHVLAVSSVVVLLAACGSRGAPSTPAGASPASELVYQLDRDALLVNPRVALARSIERRFVELKIDGTVRTSRKDHLDLLVADPARHGEVATVAGELSEAFERGACEAADGPGAICLRARPSYVTAVEAAALERAVETVRARLAKHPDVTVRASAGQIRIGLPSSDPAVVASVRRIVGRDGRLELRAVDSDAEYMRRLYAHVGNPDQAGAAFDERARRDGIRAEEISYDLDDSTGRRSDGYLVAPDRAVLQRYVEELARTRPELRPAADRELGYERLAPDASRKTSAPRWRIHYLERAVALDGSSVTQASASHDPHTGIATVLLDFDRAGAEALRELTSRVAGRRVAILFDGTIVSAPIVTGPIGGGRASISMGGLVPAEEERAAQEMVGLLKAGSLAAPLREVVPAAAPATR